MKHHSLPFPTVADLERAIKDVPDWPKKGVVSGVAVSIGSKNITGLYGCDDPIVGKGVNGGNFDVSTSVAIMDIIANRIAMTAN